MKVTLRNGGNARPDPFLLAANWSAYTGTLLLPVGCEFLKMNYLTPSFLSREQMADHPAIFRFLIPLAALLAQPQQLLLLPT